MLLNPEQERFLRAMLTNMRVISVALIGGVIVFLLVVLFVVRGDPPQGSPILSYVGLAVGTLALVLALVVPGLIGGTIKRALIEGKRVELPAQFRANPEVGILGNLVFLYQTRLIIGFAILEGAAFLNLVAYMLERQQATLVLVGLLLAAMLMKFPTRGKVESWLADETRMIDELRSLRPDRR